MELSSCQGATSRPAFGVSGGEGLIALLRPDRIVAVATEMKSPASVDDFIRAVKGLTSSYGTAAAAA